MSNSSCALRTGPWLRVGVLTGGVLALTVIAMVVATDHGRRPAGGAGDSADIVGRLKPDRTHYRRPDRLRAADAKHPEHERPRHRGVAGRGPR